MDELLNYISRGEWKCGLEESLYKRFFRIYRLQAMAMNDSRMEDIYNAVYVPFILDAGKNMVGIVNLFNSLPDAIILYYSKKRHDYLVKNKIQLVKHGDNLTTVILNDYVLGCYMNKEFILV